jgi:hypothetical protein
VWIQTAPLYGGVFLFLFKISTMPITAAFTASQSADCTTFQITDTTNYAAPETRAAMTSRFLYIYKSDGSLYRTINFSYASFPTDVITISDIDQDYAFTINLEITPATPVTGSVYSISRVVTLVCYSKVALFERINKMTIEPGLVNNSDYIRDSMKIIIDIEAAKNAESDSDILSSQHAIDRIKFITDNDAIYG